MSPLVRKLRAAARKRDRALASVDTAYEEIDRLLLDARAEGCVAEAAAILGVRREQAWVRIRRYEERRNNAT